MKVVSIRHVTLPEEVEVYDLSVPGLCNFKLHNGSFVHNSKDCSDAMAGVIYGLTMRRDVWSQHGVQFAVQYLSTKEVKVNNEASE